MAYLVKEDLYTHIYPEILTEIVRDYKTPFENFAAFPEVGITGRYYIDSNNSKYYKWNGDVYVETPYIDLIAAAIKNGIAEAKIYLNRFDKVKMLSDDDTLRTFKDDWFDGLVKDLVCWQLLKLANPNIELKLFRTAYEDARKQLIDAMNGKTDPGWPLYNNPATDLDESGFISASSNKKRNQFY